MSSQSIPSKPKNFIALSAITVIALLASALWTPPVARASSPATSTTTAVPEPASSQAGPWNLVFDSEFSGTTLDSSQWSTGWFGSGITKGINSLEQECMDPAQVSVDNGLTLTAIAQPETCGGVTQPYTSGMVTSDGHFSYTYGYAEAKIWLPGTSSISDWPAFWVNGVNWPVGGEDDIMEGLGGSAQAHLHYQDASGAYASVGPLVGTGTYTGGWHTFASDWEPGSVTYFYDGFDIGSLSTGVGSAPMYLILDLAVASAITSPISTPAAMKVAYVRVWQRPTTLPPTTTTVPPTTTTLPPTTTTLPPTTTTLPPTTTTLPPTTTTVPPTTTTLPPTTTTLPPTTTTVPITLAPPGTPKLSSPGINASQAWVHWGDAGGPASSLTAAVYTSSSCSNAPVHRQELPNALDTLADGQIHFSSAPSGVPSPGSFSSAHTYYVKITAVTGPGGTSQPSSCLKIGRG